jgi:hypothetical protein
MPDGETKNAAHLAIQQRNTCGGKVARSREWMNARGIERFVTINVTEPAQAMLIHQERFDLPRTTQKLAKLRQGNLQRIGP